MIPVGLVYFAVCGHQHALTLEAFLHPQNARVRAASLGLLSPVSPRQPLSCSSWSMGLSALDSSCRWSHTRYGLLPLASFTSCNVFKLPPFCTSSTSFFLLRMRSHCVEIPCFVYSSGMWVEIWVAAALGAIRTSMPYIWVQSCVGTHVFVSPGSVPRSGMAGSPGNSRLNFLRT